MNITNPYNPKDDRGDIVHAHGGQIIPFGEYFYWIGENRLSDIKVSCYRTKDFSAWEFCNDILKLSSKTEKHYFETDLTLDINDRKAMVGKGCNIERAKIIYNRKTGKFIMWMHWEMPDNYCKARAAIAVSDTIDGDYTYLGSFNPLGHMSRDCTLFVDDDDTAYFISASNENNDLHMYKLTDDYLAIDSLVKVLWKGEAREAPTVFKKDNLYYILSSACTGWAPNQSTFSYSDKIDGIYSPLKNFGDKTTYTSQPTCVLPINDGDSTNYYYIGDRWGGNGDDYFSSSTIILPIEFNEDNSICIKWNEYVK